MEEPNEYEHKIYTPHARLMFVKKGHVCECVRQRMLIQKKNNN